MIAFESALEAIMARDLPALEEIFEKYPELSKRDKNKKYPTDHEGRTLLYLAVGDKFEGLEGQAKKKAEEANFEITNFLINQNPSSVNQVRNNNNASPLFLATQNNKIDLIHLLLSLGADYQHKTRVKIGDKTQEITALELANKKSAAISIEMGQAIKLIKNTSPEKIYDCINHGFPFLIGKLIKDKKLSQEEIDRLLILMSRSRNFPMVQFLVDNGANINTFDPETGATPAMISSQQGDLKTLAFLVDAGINPKALTKIGHSILISALLPNLKLDVLKFLLSTGKFDPNYPANTENAFILLTTSHYPFSKDVEEAMSDLIAAGADVDFKLKNGDEIITPLSVASEIYDLRKVKFLLENSAHIKNQQSLKDFIIRYSKFPKTKLEAKEILSLIIDDARKHGVKIDINDQFTFENIKCTLLHCLVLITPKNITTIALLELGANPRIRSMFGIKPIDFVDKSKNEELYFYLYNYEKFLNIKDRLQKNLQDKITIKNADKETFSIELKFKNVTKLIKCNDEKSESKIITEIRSQLELLRVGNQKKELPKTNRASPFAAKESETTQQREARLAQELANEEVVEKRQLIKAINNSITEINNSITNQKQSNADVEELKTIVTNAFKGKISSDLLTQKNKLYGIWLNLCKNINDPKEWFKFNQQFFIFISRIDLLKSKQEDSDKIINLNLANNLKQSFANFHIHLFCQIKNQDFSLMSLAELRDIKLLFEQIKNLQQNHTPKKELAKIHSKQQLAAIFLDEELRGKNVESALEEAINKYEAAEWARIFGSKSLQYYSIETLEKIAPYFTKKLAGLEPNESNKLIENIARYLVDNNNIAKAAFKASIFLDSLNEDQKFKLQNQLYQKFNQLENNNLRKTASFLVAVENLIFKTEDSPKTVETVDALVVKELEGLRPNIDQFANQDWQQKTKQDKGIILALNKLKIDEKFTVILLYSPHGRQVENPHIQKNHQQLITENLATTKQELEEKLGQNTLEKIKEEDLQKVTKILADNFCHVKTRGSGSHNSCIVLPKIFPNKKSPITDEQERLSYIANINELCQAVASQRITQLLP